VSEPSRCSECHGTSLYRTTTKAGATNGALSGIYFDLLPNLGSTFAYADMDIVVCGDCGHIRLYASRGAREKLAQAGGWNKL
jgi:hypothetical protein